MNDYVRCGLGALVCFVGVGPAGVYIGWLCGAPWWGAFWSGLVAVCMSVEITFGPMGLD